MFALPQHSQPPKPKNGLRQWWQSLQKLLLTSFSSFGGFAKCIKNSPQMLHFIVRKNGVLSTFTTLESW
jgi:hypothetical protein